MDHSEAGAPYGGSAGHETSNSSTKVSDADKKPDFQTTKERPERLPAP